jgi:hypothetical protein
MLTGGPSAIWEQAAFLGPKSNPFVAGNPNEENYRVRDLIFHSCGSHRAAQVADGG